MRRVVVGLIIAIALGLFAGAVGAMAGSMRTVSHSGHVRVVSVYLCNKTVNQ